MVALAVYTYARAGELAALEWTDIDLEHGTMHIHRSLDVKRGRGIKSTKSDVARRVPIEGGIYRCENKLLCKNADQFAWVRNHLSGK